MGDGKQEEMDRPVGLAGSQRDGGTGDKQTDRELYSSDQ